MRWWQTRKALKTETRKFLSALGGTSPEVASSLAAAGVDGIPGNAEQCAVATYLGAIIPAEPAVSSVVVGTHRVYLRLRDRRRPVTIKLPHQVRDLIEGFDSELYPVLIRRPLDQQGQPGPDKPSADEHHEASGLL